MNAIWGTDYDYHTDKCYKRPCCGYCNEPVSDKGICYACGKQNEFVGTMRSWWYKRKETKVKENEYCLSCGKNDCTVTYVRNKVTLKWQAAYGECKCGAKFVV